MVLATVQVLGTPHGDPMPSVIVIIEHMRCVCVSPLSGRFGSGMMSFRSLSQDAVQRWRRIAAILYGAQDPFGEDFAYFLH
jgi:hypothetical protein